MLRRIMGAAIAFMLVATLLMPLAPVGAQEDEVEPGPAPVLSEQSAPESEPPPAVEESPIEEPQSEAPVAQEPVIEEPVAEEPAIEEPVAEEPVSESPPVGVDEPAADVPAAPEDEEATATDEESAQDAGEDDVAEADEPSDEGTPSSITGLTVDCSGLVSFTFLERNGDAIGVVLTTSDPSYDSYLEEGFYLSYESDSFLELIPFEGSPSNVIATVYSDEQAVVPIGSASVDCGEPSDPDEETPDEPTGQGSVVSAASLACDGTLTFTITEAADETLSIRFTNLHAPTVGQDMGAVDFPVTGTGTFQVSIARDSWVDVFQADIYSPIAGDFIEQAAAYGCISGEEQTLGGVANMTLTCAGVATFNIFGIDGVLSIRLYDGSTDPQTLIASEGLGYIIDGGGDSRTVDFGLEAGVYDSLVVRAYAHNNWAPLDIAYATDCLTEEPGGEVAIENLTVTCDGLISFDVTTSNPVTLNVAFFIPAAAPGYRVSTQITASTGPQQVQLTPRSNGAFEWYASVSLGNEELAYANVMNCAWRPPNTMPGSDVAVETDGGTITFDEVLEVGDTTVTQLDPSEVPALPAEFEGYQVILLDITTTAQFAGSVQVCLPVAIGAENVRLLHFEGGAWVDITTSAGNGQVCGVTSSFSPFAIVYLADDQPGEPVHPGQPGGPDKPGHHGKPEWQHSSSQDTGSGGNANPTSLPVTGAGAQTAHSGAETVQLMIGALALIAAAGLHFSSSQTRGARSR